MTSFPVPRRRKPPLGIPRARFEALRALRRGDHVSIPFLAYFAAEGLAWLSPLAVLTPLGHAEVTFYIQNPHRVY